MLFNKEIEGLLDDSFEGSINEHQIFTEVFFGKGHEKTSKKCLVTGAINFECDKSKQKNVLLSLNSETSAITSQLDSSNVNCLRENPGPGCLPNENVGSVKRIKLSADKCSVLPSVTCRLVESSNQGVTSSSYLLKGDVSKRRFPSINEISEKKNCASKAIHSPLSPDIFADKSQSLKCGEDRITRSMVDKSFGRTTTSIIDSTKDFRPILREYIQNLLRTTGWEITKRKKDDRDWGFIYLSPQTRRPIREFHKAWNLCGQSLSINRNLVVLEDGTQWNDMSDFLSDLSTTLSKIDKDMHSAETSSLGHQWCLLDPFANVVFIEKKLGMLKEGDVVKTRSCVLIDSQVNKDAVFSLKTVDGVNNSLRGSPPGFCEWSLVGGSVLTNTEANNCISSDSCGTRITVDFGQSNRGTVKALNGIPVNFSEERCTISGITNGLNSNALQACGLDGNSDHSSNCLYDVPNVPKNGMFASGEAVSPPQDGSTNCLTSERYVSYHNDEVALEIDRSVQTGSPRREVQSSSVDPELLSQDIDLNTPLAQSGNVQKKSVTCQIKVDNLLIAGLIKNNLSRSTVKRSTREIKPHKNKPRRKRKTQKGGCRLLPRSLVKGGKHTEGNWFVFASRTPLSWLINSRVVSVNEVIHYQNPKDNSSVKEGLITKDGILCTCCNKVLSVSIFKFHAGARLNCPCSNLVMGSGKPFTLCLHEAWSNEYKVRKSPTRPVQVENMDENDDSCGLCGDGGELICCDNCPSTFHQKCLSEQELPEGHWYCQHCTCGICGDLVNDKEASKSSGALKCSQCDHKYHKACLKDKVGYREAASETWFCGEYCQVIYLGLQSHIGVLNALSDGFSWTLLRCIHVDEKVHAAQRSVALRAECNSKLAVALTIMEECFLSMVDARTGIDMIPHLLFNWGSEFARLNYHGFYTMVLEKDDVLISVASIRIHGVTVAEMPLIATCSKYRRQGMCRRLMNSIEEMLKSFKVEKLVITAIPDLVETWIVGFGFEPLEEHERKSLSNINLMVFPGTVWLKKPIYKNEAADEQTSCGHAASFCKDDQAETGLCFDGVAIDDFARPSNGSVSLEEGANETENRDANSDTGIVGNSNLHEDFSKMSHEEPALTEGQSQAETVSLGESDAMNNEQGLARCQLQ